jgi:hypothetical protein
MVSGVVIAGSIYLIRGKGEIMKVKEITGNKFTPFKIEIEIETEGELVELWHRMNAKLTDVNEHRTHETKEIEGFGDSSLWAFLNDKIEKLNIKL